MIEIVAAIVVVAFGAMWISTKLDFIRDVRAAHRKAVIVHKPSWYGDLDLLTEFRQDVIREAMSAGVRQSYVKGAVTDGKHAPEIYELATELEKAGAPISLQKGQAAQYVVESWTLDGRTNSAGF